MWPRKMISSCVCSLGVLVVMGLLLGCGGGGGTSQPKEIPVSKDRLPPGHGKTNK